MLTLQTLRLYGFCVNASFLSGFSPFIWYFDRKRVVVIQGKVKWGWVSAFQLGFQTYLLYLIGVIVFELCFKKEPQFAQLPLVSGVAFMLCLFNLVTFSIFFQREQLAQLINTFHYFCDSFEGKLYLSQF